MTCSGRYILVHGESTSTCTWMPMRSIFVVPTTRPTGHGVVPALCLFPFLCQICSLPGFCGIADGHEKFPPIKSQVGIKAVNAQPTPGTQQETENQVRSRVKPVFHRLVVGGVSFLIGRSNTSQDQPQPTNTIQTRR